MKVDWKKVGTGEGEELPASGSRPVLGFVTLPEHLGGGRIVAQVIFSGNEFMYEFLWQGRYSVYCSHWAEPIEMPEEAVREMWEEKAKQREARDGKGTGQDTGQ